MAKPAVKKIDIEKIADLYLTRFKGQPDAMRLVMNMLADNLTNIDKLKEQIIKHEFSTFIAKPKANKTSIIQQLAETYGMSKSKVVEIIKND
ncbi:MAG: hypothetical protein SH857_12045 [Chitinophagales bacterium]|nr:hypothetical protein [Chitinophagales bacterium]